MKIFYRLLSVFFMITSFFLVWQSVYADEKHQMEDYPILKGSFVQPEILEQWHEKDWVREFEQMKVLKMDHLILQWSAHSKFNTTVFSSDIEGFEQETSKDLIQMLLKMGDSYQIDIYLGLQLNHDFFQSEGTNERWLAQQAQISESLIETIFDKYGDESAFKGWYLPFEVDNWNFQHKDNWKKLIAYYQPVIKTVN